MMFKRAMKMKNSAILVVAIVTTVFCLGSSAFAQSGITGPSQMNRCDQGSFTITVHNDSATPACNLVVTSTIPASGFSYVANSANISFCGSHEPTVNGNELIWDIDALCGMTQLNPWYYFTISYDLLTDCEAVSGSNDVRIDYSDCPTGGSYNDTDGISIEVLPGGGGWRQCYLDLDSRKLGPWRY